MPTRIQGPMAALGAVLIWGFTFVPSKLALAEMGPFTLAALRFSVALAAILPIALRGHPSSAAWRKLSLPTVAPLGLTGVALYFGLQNLGLARTTAAEAGLMSATVPALTALLSAALLREPLGLGRLAGILASLVGVALVVLSPADAAGSRGSLEGDLMVLGASLAWAVYTLLGKRVAGRAPDTVLLACTMAIGTLLLLPAAALEQAPMPLPNASASAWLSVLFLGLGGSAASFFCWNAALRRMDASAASIYINLVPVVTLISSALLLHESLLPAQLLGGALVLMGVYLAGR